MASSMERFSRYKLRSVFHDNTVVHTTYKSDLRLGLRKVEVKATWTREKKLGSGAFGVVWLEKELGGTESTGAEFRAVKIVSKEHLNVREVDVLTELQDVKTPSSSPPLSPNN